MRIITYKPLQEFYSKHPDSKQALDEAYLKLKASDYNSLVELQKTFPSAEVVGRVTVINIKGNHYRLLLGVHYNTQKIFILEVLTHAEYSKGTWKKRYQT